MPSLDRYKGFVTIAFESSDFESPSQEEEGYALEVSSDALDLLNINYSTIAYSLKVYDSNGDIVTTYRYTLTFDQETHIFNLLMEAPEPFTGIALIEYTYTGLTKRITENRRLLDGQKVVYPFTKQENIIGLQKTISDKLPIVSASAPSSGTFVEKQIWLDIGSEEDSEERAIQTAENPNEYVI